MREARQSSDGRWYMVEEDGDVCRLSTSAWGKDQDGFWPKVEIRVNDLDESVICPNCGTSWVFEEMDCVFGMARKEENDVIVLVRCLGCRLPHSTRAVGFVTAYPRVIQLMEGWSDWEKRDEDFRAQEAKLYGLRNSESDT